MPNTYTTQNDLLLNNLLEFYKLNNNMDRMINIINGESRISLRIIDWFATNYAKKNFTIYQLPGKNTRFKVYNDYKLKLKAYSKRRFDPFCRWERITIPISEGNEYCFETTIGQLNFFKWALENKVIDFIEKNYDCIEKDMNENNSLSKTRKNKTELNGKTRKKREELSVNAIKTFKQESVEVIVKFN